MEQSFIQLLKEFKSNIQFDKFIKPDHGRCHYGYANLFWLELVLKLMGKVSYKDKIYFLQDLKDHDELDIFYQNIGVQFRANAGSYPTLATWSEYKHAILTEDNAYLEQLNEIIAKFKPQLESYLQCAVDGKDIRHSHDKERSSHSNIKSINVISDKQLIHTDIAQHEGAWIKQFFKGLCLDLKKS